MDSSAIPVTSRDIEALASKMESAPERAEKPSGDLKIDVANRVGRWFAKWKEKSQGDHEHIANWRRMDGGHSLRHMYPGSDQHLPVAERNKLTLVRHMVEGLYPADSEWFTAKPEDPSQPMAHESARDQVLLLDNQLSTHGFALETADNLSDDATDGTGIYMRVVKDDVAVEEESVPEAVDVIEPPDGNGPAITVVKMRRVTRQERRQSYPWLERLDSLRVFPSHVDGVHSLDDLDGIAVVSPARIEEILQQAWRTETGDPEPDGNGGYVIRLFDVGRYRNLDALKGKRPRALEMSGLESSEENTGRPVQSGGEETVWGHQIVSILTQLPLRSVLFGSGIGDETMPEMLALRAKQEEEFRRDFGIQDDDESGHGRWWAIDTFDGVLIRCECVEFPLLRSHWRRVSDRFWGKSHYMLSKGAQELLDTCLTAGRDGLIRTMYNMWAVRDGTLDTSRGTIDEVLGYMADKAILFDQNASVDDALKPIAPPASSISGAFDLGLPMALNLGRLASGAEEPLDGASSSGRRSATEAQQRASAAMTPVSHANFLYERGILQPFINWAMKINRAVFRGKVAIETKGAKEPRMIGPENLMARVNAIPKGTSEMVSWLVQSQALDDAVAKYGQTGVVNFLEAFKMTLRLKRIPDYESLVQVPPPPMPPGPQGPGAMPGQGGSDLPVPPAASGAPMDMGPMGEMPEMPEEAMSQ